MKQRLKDLRHARDMDGGTISNYRLIRSNREVMRKLRNAEPIPHEDKIDDSEDEDEVKGV